MILIKNIGTPLTSRRREWIGGSGTAFALSLKFPVEHTRGKRTRVTLPSHSEGIRVLARVGETHKVQGIETNTILRVEKVNRDNSLTVELTVGKTSYRKTLPLRGPVIQIKEGKKTNGWISYVEKVEGEFEAICPVVKFQFSNGSEGSVTFPITQYAPYQLEFEEQRVVVFGELKTTRSRISKLGLVTRVFGLDIKAYGHLTTKEGLIILEEGGCTLSTHLVDIVNQETARNMEPKIEGELFQVERIKVTK